MDANVTFAGVADRTLNKVQVGFRSIKNKSISLGFHEKFIKIKTHEQKIR